MGVLAPLYLAGLAALSLPLILHLIRRTPRGRQVFSTLMFLQPSPPRLTRRSRLDQILLLLLRLAALALLAFAFARPFLREAATLAFEDLPRRRVAILMDTSASMRRNDLWQQAVKHAEKELADLSPHDEVALFAFADRLQTVINFDSNQEGDHASRIEIVRKSLQSLSPGWAATDLGAALTAAASELDAVSDTRQIAAEQQILLISDFQKGSRTEALQSFEWPQRVHVTPRHVTPRISTNAFAHLLMSEEDSAETALRVRMASAADSSGDQFFVHWAKEGDSPAAEGQTAVYVPPGQSRVVRLPRPDTNLLADRLITSGDNHDFDNTFYVVPPRKQDVKILYIGADAEDDQRSPQYYLRLAATGDPLRNVEITSLTGDDAPDLAGETPPHLVVVTRQVSTRLLAELKAYAERGGTLLVAPTDHEAAASVITLAGDLELREKPTKSSDFLLLGEIDFAHPLFAPFANPRYSDFTKIHFWKHRPLALKDGAISRIVAKFDNGDPALIEKGHTYLLASGWNPDDSQLALSTKFVPLIGALLDQACGAGQTLASVVVGQPVSLPAPASASPLIVVKPSGKEVAHQVDATSFTETDEPGIYRAGAGTSEVRFAVNLAAAECNTAPLEMEQLEQLGVRFAAGASRTERLDRIRQERDTELESRQKIWRWMIVAALGILIVETCWAGHAARQVARTMEVAA